MVEELRDHERRCPEPAQSDSVSAARCCDSNAGFLDVAWMSPRCSAACDALRRYVSNLNGKVRKDELRHALYCLFSQVKASAAAEDGVCLYC